MYNPLNDRLKVIILGRKNHRTVSTKTLIRWCKKNGYTLEDNGENSEFAVIMCGIKFIGLVRDF
jgi:hypothetical protein